MESDPPVPKRSRLSLSRLIKERREIECQANSIAQPSGDTRSSINEQPSETRKDFEENE